MRETSKVAWLEEAEKEEDRNVADSEEFDAEDGKVLIRHIPEELIEAIVSKVSYPSLYQARLLSRSWYTKFCVPHELVHTSTARFQNGVTAAAVKWPTYSPVSVFGKEILGFNRVSNCWHKQAIHESVPVDICAEEFINWRLAFAGSLMCAVGRSNDRSLKFLVANTLTGDWNLLPFPPEDTEHPFLDFRFVRTDCQNYKILVHNLPCPQFQAYLYESNHNCRTWKSLTKSATAAGIPGLSPFSLYIDAYINGTLYCMSRYSMGGNIIWKFTTDTGIWDQILPHSVEFDSEEFPGGMFQCGTKLLVVTLLQVNSLSVAAGKQMYPAANVYELNLESLKLTKISTSPPELLMSTETATLVADAECIYFCDIRDQRPASFISFNVNEHSWSCLPTPSPQYELKWGRFCTFQPGLNPFASP